MAKIFDSLSKYSYGPGSTKLFGVNLPELGFSEALGGNKDSVYQAAKAKTGIKPAQTNVVNQSYAPADMIARPNQSYATPEDLARYSTSSNTSSSNTGGYSSSELFKQYGLDPNKKSAYFKENNVNNTPDLIKVLIEKAKKDNAAQLASLNSQYDNIAETLRSNLDSLGRQRENSLASLDLGYQNFQGDINSQRTRAQQDYEKNVADAQSSTQAVQRANRNTLRALGILGSTAAGDMLARPLEQFDKTRAGLVQTREQRIQELENALNQKTQEHLLAKRSLEDQFVSLVDKIRNDLAFNDRQKANAIQQAQLALQDNLNKIALQQMAFEQQAVQQAQNLQQSTADLSSYIDNGADTSGIYGSAFLSPEGRDQQNASIYQPSLSDLADPYGIFARKDQQQSSLSALGL